MRLAELAPNEHYAVLIGNILVQGLFVALENKRAKFFIHHPGEKRIIPVFVRPHDVKGKWEQFELKKKELQQQALLLMKPIVEQFNQFSIDVLATSRFIMLPPEQAKKLLLLLPKKKGKPRGKRP